MIKVTVELISALDGSKKHLGTAHISNTGEFGRDNPRGNYKVELFTGGKGKRTRLWKSRRVEGFQRKKLLAWDLLYRALNCTVGGRNW